jgi:hypothetical protein
LTAELIIAINLHVIVEAALEYAIRKVQESQMGLK